jgi:hypothetical protein
MDPQGLISRGSQLKAKRFTVIARQMRQFKGGVIEKVGDLYEQISPLAQGLTL